MQPHGSGIFSWCASERQSGRYGAFYLACSDFRATVHRDVHLDLPALHALEGIHVRITVQVTESRPSGHGGDLFLQVFPGDPPAVGTTVKLAVGRLVLLDHTGFSRDDHPTQTGIGIAPSDGRRQLWLNPSLLYRLHDQTVELTIRPTSEPESPPSPLIDRTIEDGVMVNLDGESLQTRGAAFSDGPVLILPVIEHDTSTLRVHEPCTAPGKRLSVVPTAFPSSGVN